MQEPRRNRGVQQATAWCAWWTDGDGHREARIGNLTVTTAQTPPTAQESATEFDALTNPLVDGPSRRGASMALPGQRPRRQPLPHTTSLRTPHRRWACENHSPEAAHAGTERANPEQRAQDDRARKTRWQ